MLKKMFMTALAAVSMCTFAAAQSGTTDWSETKQLSYRASKTVNSGEAHDLKMLMRRLPGSFESVLTRAINRASDSNGATLLTGNSTMPMSYAEKVTWQENMMKSPITDGDAWRKLLNSVSGSERSLLESLWPDFSVREQDAILHVIKYSWRVTPPTDTEMKTAR